jgi:hypothetical protein
LPLPEVKLLLLLLEELGELEGWLELPELDVCVLPLPLLLLPPELRVEVLPLLELWLELPPLLYVCVELPPPELCVEPLLELLLPPEVELWLPELEL